MNGVHFVLGSPNAYIHEPGILSQAGHWVGQYGKSMFIVTGHKSWDSCGASLTESLNRSGIIHEIHQYRGECSYEELDRLSKLVPDRMELICGVGGGKVLDTAKALANRLAKPFVAIPTLAATCAAVANLSVMYTEDGVYIDFPVYMRGTLLCLVDTEVIAKAPARYLAAGIADTLAKWIEAPMAATGKKHNLPTIGGLQAAKLAYDTLIEHSAQAMQDANQRMPSEALQYVIDANLLISAMVAGLGEDNCRSAGAHAIHNGLTVIPETHQILHGEKVAYGILVQLALEKRPQAYIDELLAFYHAVGLPYRLEQVGIDRELSNTEWDDVARVSLLPAGTMGNMSFPVNSEMILEAFKQVEQWDVQARK